VIIDGLHIPTEHAGCLVATQGINTSWGDNLDPSQASTGGSELNQLYVNPDISGGFLTIAITGNLETAHNGFVIFLDSRLGGENTLDANGGYSSGSGSKYVTSLAGTTFDSGFRPDFGVAVNAADQTRPLHFFTNLVDLHANTDRYLGCNILGNQRSVLTEGDNLTGWSIAFDNSNVLGVGFDGAGSPSSSAPTATSGLEMRIPVADLGLQNGWQLGIQVLINNQFLPTWISNQNLPALPNGTASLGDIIPDYTQVAGDQHAVVSLIPEPASCLLLAVGAFVIATLRPRHGRWSDG
jgi:hypothetical protein